MNIEVLRMGHRPQRDKRITTHVCLTSRALGASRIHISETDASVRTSVTDLTKRFGGHFEVLDGTGWKGPIRSFQAKGGKVVHLTMYGIPMHQATKEIQAEAELTDLMVVVGAEKVPSELYDLADWNVAVGNQPHSEVAALALLLDRITAGTWEEKAFTDGEIQVIPTRHGKRTNLSDSDAEADRIESDLEKAMGDEEGEPDFRLLD